MPLPEGELYRFPAHSLAFLDRAVEALRLFDETNDVQSLFVAALMLRFGIEARLFEYIEAELPTEARTKFIRKLSDYQATKLLERLTGLNPHASTGTILTFTPVAGGAQCAMRYTPVTSELAALHGRLGGLLHFNFFKKNPYWYIADRPMAAGTPTLLVARDLIETGIAQLREATSGDLLNHPVFRVEVEHLVEELQADESDDGQETNLLAE